MPPSPARRPPGIRAARLLAVLALGCVFLGWALLLVLALDNEERVRPILALLGMALFLLTPFLGLMSLIVGRRARRRGALDPAAFESAGRMHLVVGLLALGTWGLMLALLLPVYARTPRGRARDRVAIGNLQEGLRELTEACGKAQSQGLSQEAQMDVLASTLAAHALDKNPWKRGHPGFRPRALTSGPGQAAAEELARREATERGQVVFVISPSGDSTEPRWLVGAVRIRAKEDPSAAQEGKVIMKSSRMGTP